MTKCLAMSSRSSRLPQAAIKFHLATSAHDKTTRSLGSGSIEFVDCDGLR
jgi:hypothetical protein